MDLKHITHSEKITLTHIIKKYLSLYHPSGLDLDKYSDEGENPLGTLGPLIQFARDHKELPATTYDDILVRLQGNFPSTDSITPLVYGSAPYFLD